MLMPNRHSGTENYRFGLNGMEADNNVSGTGNHYTTPFRQYSPRLGRWMTTDPIVHYWQSPYAAFNDNPIFFSDPSGLKGEGGGKGKGVASFSTSSPEIGGGNPPKELGAGAKLWNWIKGNGYRNTVNKFLVDNASNWESYSVSYNDELGAAAISHTSYTSNAQTGSNGSISGGTEFHWEVDFITHDEAHVVDSRPEQLEGGFQTSGSSRNVDYATDFNSVPGCATCGGWNWNGFYLQPTVIGGAGVDVTPAKGMNVLKAIKYLRNGFKIKTVLRISIKKTIENKTLKNIYKQLYRKGSNIGTGSTADAIRYTKDTGNLVGGSDHIQKGIDNVNGLKALLKSGNLSEGDIKIANELLNNLKNALNQ